MQFPGWHTCTLGATPPSSGPPIARSPVRPPSLWLDALPNCVYILLLMVDVPDRERLLAAQGCTNRRLRRTARALTEFYDLVMAPSGLHSNQFTLLIPVYLKPGLTIGQLARLSDLDRTTLARNLKLLQARRLLAIRPGDDQRTRSIELTEPGRQAVERARPLWEQAQRQVAGVLGDAQIDQLYGYLDTLAGLRQS